ncbi:class I SAM-dependent methyltransferase [Candidatus Nanohalococcus occultus]|uniref:tRNA (Guanine37-N1)-methyltransferase n=1 Tax=Candidatus Nanohalococcus occultus TaxID=2978047 RepID=A0ABY8CFP4_9ARCH|nr:tRNA (guanine37-N1)-methyltransferase [Candidatus Nanohaloarchaeota archaeon SVXNc]
MKQTQLEERVRQIFEQQGFEVEKTGFGYKAEKERQSFEIQVFSSEKHSEKQVMESVEKDLVFVDEPLSAVKDQLNVDVSVLEERNDEEYDLPSFEIIGDIAVINELVDLSREEAVEGILNSNPNVETILLKTDSLSGEFRVGDYEKLYGEETETVHKEFGCRLKVDPTKVYFSERFSTERKRVIDQIEDGEKVLVMFAGVGPFAILAAKHANPEKVVAVEKNPIAAEYLEENIELNSLEGLVEGYEGDVEEIVPELGEKFDRIIMPLPGMADKFLSLAVDSAAENAVVHYYRFLEEGNWESLDQEIEALAEEFDVLDRTVCGERSPSSQRVCVDIMLRNQV